LSRNHRSPERTRSSPEGASHISDGWNPS